MNKSKHIDFVGVSRHRVLAWWDVCHSLIHYIIINTLAVRHRTKQWIKCKSYHVICHPGQISLKYGIRFFKTGVCVHFNQPGLKHRCLWLLGLSIGVERLRVLDSSLGAHDQHEIITNQLKCILTELELGFHTFQAHNDLFFNLTLDVLLELL